MGKRNWQLVHSFILVFNFQEADLESCCENLELKLQETAHLLAEKERQTKGLKKEVSTQICLYCIKYTIPSSGEGNNNPILIEGERKGRGRIQYEQS